MIGGIPHRQKSQVKSIVAVHGLGGDWERTWTDENGKLWLRDFLPAQLPRARIMLYGYNADTAFSKSVAGIEDEAGMLLDRIDGKRQQQMEMKRPIIFISHSLGGIIVKKAMILAHERSSVYRDLLNSVRGVVFFGVPHRGSDSAYWGNFVATLLRVIQPQINTRFVNALQSNSETLADISKQFIERAAELDIRTFYETEMLYNQLIVDKNSAILNLPNEIAVGIAGSNHKTICKFSDADSQKYKQVGDAVKKLAQKATRFGTTSQFHSVTPYRTTRNCSPYFTGRGSLLKRLKDIFGPQADQPQRRRDFLLYGMGGAGKTQICLKFAEENSDRFWRIFWIDATSTETLETSFQDIADDPIARANGVKDSTGSILQWLSIINQEWLLIFDNAEESPDLIARYLPPGRQGNVLITSRNPNMQRIVAQGAWAEVEEMEEDEAVSLLSKAALLDTPSDENMVVMRLIVRELGFLALAIDQAGAAIANGVCYVHDYLHIYSRHRRDLLGHPSFGKMSEYGLSVYGTLDVSFKAICETASRTSNPVEAQAAKNAIIILQAFAFFHHENIMEEIFKRAAEFRRKPAHGYYVDENKDLPRASNNLPHHILEVDEEGYWDPFAFREGTRVLQLFSLIRRGSSKGIYFMHPLMHSWSRERMPKVEQQDVSRSANALLSSSITFGYTTKDYIFRRKLLPHIHAYRQHVGGVEISRTYNDDEMENYGLVFEENCYWKEAEELQTQVMEKRTQVLGAEHPSTLRSMAHLATTIFNQGRWKESLTLRERTIEAMNRVLGEDHPETLRVVTDLCVIYSAQGKCEKAEMMQERSVSIIGRLLGETHRDTLASMASLANIYLDCRKLDKAEELQVKVLETRKTALGEEHPDTVMSMISLAETYRVCGELDKAKEMSARARQIKKRTLGEGYKDLPARILEMAAEYIDLNGTDERQHRWNTAPIKEFRKQSQVSGLQDSLTSMKLLASQSYRDCWREM